MIKEIYKVIIVGNSGVGKTNLTQKYVLNTFMENEPNTIGVAYLTKTFHEKEKIRLKNYVSGTQPDKKDFFLLYKCISKIVKVLYAYMMSQI